MRFLSAPKTVEKCVSPVWAVALNSGLHKWEGSECVVGGAFTERSACVRGVVQLGRPNEDGQVDTRPPCLRRVGWLRGGGKGGGGEVTGDYADFCLPSPR